MDGLSSKPKQGEINTFLPFLAQNLTAQKVIEADIKKKKEEKAADAVIRPLQTKLKKLHDTIVSLNVKINDRKTLIVQKPEHEANADAVASWNPYDQNQAAQFFHLEWMFSMPHTEGVSFDVVIGNPPYVQIQKLGREKQLQFEKQAFQTYDRTGDIYELFYERGCGLLAPNGVLCYITSNKWMRAKYGASTRRFLSNRTNPLQIIDFGNVQIFESATVDTNILITQRAKYAHKAKACRVDKANWNEQTSLAQYVADNNYPLSIESLWTVLTSIQWKKEKLELASNEDLNNPKDRELDIFSKFESMPKGQKAQFSFMASMLATNLINTLADAIKMRPMRVNFMQVMLVEMWFSVSNTRSEPIPSYKIIDGKLKIGTKEKREEPKERIQMMLGDIGRKLHLMKDAMQDYATLETQSQTIFTGNMPSTDPLFGQYFALTLSQCSAYDVQEFLDFQKEQYHRDFNSFLSITLLKYKDLLTEEHIVLAHEWLSKSTRQTVEPQQQVQEVKIETESMTSEVLSEHSYTAISGKLSAKKINRFFDFLHEQKSKNKQRFLSKEQVEQLKTIGLTLPNDEPSLRFTLNLTNRDYKTIYTCFYELWRSHHFAKNGGKDAYAKFLKTYFTDFDKTQLATVQNSLQPESATIIGFNIKAYLPNFDPK